MEAMPRNMTRKEIEAYLRNYKKGEGESLIAFYPTGYYILHEGEFSWSGNFLSFQGLLIQMKPEMSMIDSPPSLLVVPRTEIVNRLGYKVLCADNPIDGETITHYKISGGDIYLYSKNRRFVVSNDIYSGKKYFSVVCNYSNSEEEMHVTEKIALACFDVSIDPDTGDLGYKLNEKKLRGIAKDSREAVRKWKNHWKNMLGSFGLKLKR